MTHSITVELSDIQFRQLKRASELTQQPIQTLVSNSLVQNMTPVIEDVPEEYQRDVLPLLEMNEADLYQEGYATFPPGQWDIYEQLLTKQKEQPLSFDDRQQLDMLRRQADVLMLRKGYAALLLKRRGYQPPIPESLPLPT